MTKMDLGSERTFPNILRLAVPSMIAQLVNVLYSIVDRIYVGNMPGDGQQALVGVGVVAPICTAISSFAFLVGLGGAPLFSIALGEKNDKRAKKIMANALLMLIILSTVLMILLYACLNPMLFAFGASEVSFPYARTYMLIYLAGTYFSLIATGMAQFLIAQGESFKNMITTAVACLFNIALDPLFMYVFHMGISGAALATITCQGISFLLCISFLLHSPIKLSFGQYDIKLMIRILKLGFSPFIILVTDSVILIAINAVLEKVGGADGDFYIEVQTITMAFETLITGPLLGISSGTQPLLGYNYGAKNFKNIKKAETQLILFALIFCTTCFGLSFLLSGPFARMFVGFSAKGGTDSERIIQASIKYIRIYMIGIIPLAFQYIFVDGLTGMGQASKSIWLSLARKIFIFLPLSIILPLATHDAGMAFYAEMIADCASAVIATTSYLIMIPKIFKKREAEAVVHEDVKPSQN
jgi:putative MATE family efflux protein